MNKKAKQEWDDYFKNRIPPKKFIMTPELEADFNSPYFKNKEEMYKRNLKECPPPFGKIIWKD